MKYALNYEEEYGIIICRSLANLSFEEIIETIHKIDEFAKQHNCYLLLSDVRKIEASLKITEILDLTKYYKHIPLVEKFKNAILYSESSSIRNNIDFYESLCHTAGYRTKSFTSEQHAIKWLQNTQCPNSCKTFTEH